ncbi:hypothetical protein C8F04DRAFT_1190558 [Mycena alexandri]|uniref:Uncharacterized protein n=1 Tax=Mycena alexandri TaxID=1745969 RepID=A0AAD6SET6_9AGAR|nr:hypothetical protein C8F04DRAFT_1190558 [Mycena alexandri]
MLFEGPSPRTFSARSDNVSAVPSSLNNEVNIESDKATTAEAAPSTQSDTEFWPMSNEEIAFFLAAYPAEGNTLVDLGAPFNSERRPIILREIHQYSPSRPCLRTILQNSSAFTFAEPASTPDTSTEFFVAPAAPDNYSLWALPPVSTNSPLTSIEEPLDTVSSSSTLPKKRRRDEVDLANILEPGSVRSRKASVRKGLAKISIPRGLKHTRGNLALKG